MRRTNITEADWEMHDPSAVVFKRRPKITNADIDTVATEIETFALDLPSLEGLVNSHPPAVRVIHCALSLNRRYEAFVRPRENAFICKHPEIKQITELDDLIASYPKPHAFAKQELDYNWEDWATMLHEVVRFLVTIVQQTPTISEEEALKRWLAQKHSQIERLTVNGKNINRFAFAGFQYLCMLFGVDTVKPDKYIIEFVSKLLSRKVSDRKAHALLEAACEQVGVSARAVDKFLWKRGEQRARCC